MRLKTWLMRTGLLRKLEGTHEGTLALARLDLGLQSIAAPADGAGSVDVGAHEL